MEQILAIDKRVAFPSETHSLRYRLLAETGPEGTAHYGVAAEILETGEHSEVHDLTTDAVLARELLRRIARGQVTPLSLREVAEDFVGEM